MVDSADETNKFSESGGMQDPNAEEPSISPQSSPESSEKKETPSQGQLFADEQDQPSVTVTAQSSKKDSGKYRRKTVPGDEARTTSHSSKMADGYKLEYRMKRLLFYMGYFSKIGIDIVTSSDANADKITDLDVYGIYIHKDFTSKSTWVDCKSGGVEIHKRISWIKGIMGEIRVNDMIFVATGARTSVKQYARKSGIQILDLKIIDKLERDFNIKEHDWRGSWNPATQFNKTNDLSKLNVQYGLIFRKIARFIPADYWVLDDYTRSKRTITAIREINSSLDIVTSKEHRELIRWALYELVGLFLLSMLNISKELYYFSELEKKESVHDGLASSDIPNARRAEMFDTAMRYAYRLVKNQYPDIELPQKIPSFNVTPPTYFEAYYDLILRITNNPFSYYDLLRFLDFVLMEYDLQSKEIDGAQLRSLFNNYADILVGAKTLLNFICQITGVPRSCFQLLSHQIPQKGDEVETQRRSLQSVQKNTVELTGGAGTGDVILENWDLFTFRFDHVLYQQNKDKGLGNSFPFKVMFVEQKGYMNIIVEDTKIAPDTVIDCGFSRPLGAHNDTSDHSRGLYQVAKRMLRESGVKTDI